MAATTDDEIAAVLSHEIAHVLVHHDGAEMSGHVLGSVAMLPMAPLILGAFVAIELAILAVLSLFIASLVMSSLSKEREDEADEIGILLMTEVGFDPTSTMLI